MTACPDSPARSLDTRLHSFVRYHPVVQGAFKKRFGHLCGWAHQTLFVYDLGSVQKKLEERGMFGFGGDSEEETDDEI